MKIINNNNNNKLVESQEQLCKKLKALEVVNKKEIVFNLSVQIKIIITHLLFNKRDKKIFPKILKKSIVKQHHLLFKIII